MARRSWKAKANAKAGTTNAANQSGAPGSDDGAAVDPAVAAFAAFVKSEKQKERDAKKAAREERAKADAANRLVAAKDEAAANLKRLKSRSGVSAEERAEAEAAYRTALAAVVASETGSTPAWAPPVEESDEATDEVGGQPSGDPGEPSSDAPTEEPEGGDGTSDDGGGDVTEAPADSDSATP